LMTISASFQLRPFGRLQLDRDSTWHRHAEENYTPVIQPRHRGVAPARQAHRAGEDNYPHGRHPGLNQGLPHLPPPRPRQTHLAPTRRPTHPLPRQPRLHHRHTTRRRTTPPLPTPLRRLRPLLRIRHLLLHPRPIPRLRPPHRIGHRHPPRSPRHRLHHPPHRTTPLMWNQKPVRPPLGQFVALEVPSGPPRDFQSHPLDRRRVP